MRHAVRNPHSRERSRNLERALVIWKDSAANPRPTLADLAAKHGLSFQRIYQLLQLAVQHFKDNFAEYCEQEKFRQVDQLERMCDTCWIAWEKSQEPLEEEFRSKTLGLAAEVIDENGNKKLGLVQDHQSKRKVKQNGDPRYLDIYLRAKADIRRLLGLDMPILVKVEDTSKISGMLARRYDDAQRRLAAPQEQQKQPEVSGNGDKPHHVN